MKARNIYSFFIFFGIFKIYAIIIIYFYLIIQYKMKFFRNKFFVGVVAVIFLLFTLQFYFVSNSYKRDTNSYVTLIDWDGTLTTKAGKTVLELNLKQKVNNGDVINTLSNSLALIEWWDKSITRLGSNSKIMIKENFVADDLSKINISFELLKWQTWSNVVSILSWDSNFTQEIKGTSAAVRGTVFEANYEKDYIAVHKHEVKLTNVGWEKKSIYTWQTFSIKEFSISEIAIQIDEAFKELNEKMDQEYIEKLRADFLAHMQKNNPISFLKNMFDSEGKVYQMLLSSEDKQAINDYIASLPEDKKQKIINTLVTLNQTLNFENGEDPELYNLKVNTRWVLIDNSQDTAYNETLVKYSMYDLSDILSLEKFWDEVYKNTVGLLGENKEYLEKLKKSLSGEGNSVTKELLNVDWFDFSPENVKNKLMEFDTKWKETLQNGASNLLNGLKK